MEKFAKSYSDVFKEQPKTILEIGSRDGDDSHFLKNFFNINDNNVYLVEPNPPQIKKIREKYSNYNLFEYAISNEIGTMKFNSIESNNIGFVGMSSLKKRRDWSTDKIYKPKSNNWIDVEVITGKMLLDKINHNIIDLVKIDVEGLTYEVLESFENDIQKLRYIHMETELLPFWENQKIYDDVYEYMKSKGFEELYKITFPWEQRDTVWYNINLKNN